MDEEKKEPAEAEKKTPPAEPVKTDKDKDLKKKLKEKYIVMAEQNW